MVTRMDRDVGRILAALKEKGVDEHTLVIFTSDKRAHKEGGADPDFFQSYGPLRGIKRDLTEGGIREPMIARLAGEDRGGEDYGPRFSPLGLPAHGLRAGGSEGAGGPRRNILLGDVFRAGAETHEFLYWEFHERGFDQALRMGDWKGIRIGLDTPLRLYNLKTDLHEDTNVAEQNPEIVAKIDAAMKSLRSENDRWVPRKARNENHTK